MEILIFHIKIIKTGNFQDNPEEFRAEELEYAARAARETVTCFFPYSGDFYKDNKFLGDCIFSAAARYNIICEYHPGVVSASGWTSSPKKHKIGHPLKYPSKIFRVDYILRLLHHHLEITVISHSAIKMIMTLRTLSAKLSKVYTVSIQLKKPSLFAGYDHLLS